MKERPILFSGPMIRAILDGRKTQTRLAVKPQPVDGISYGFEASMVVNPYGQPGDRLWVRETWRAELRWNWTAPRDITPDSPVYFEFGDEAVPACAGKKRPGMFMPRWASRIMLEIIGVRVERVQDISEADAISEGVYSDPAAPAHDGFMCLWDSINAARGFGWDVNPWVWVIEFKRV